MSADVVVELERWLAVWPNHLAGSIDVAVIQRARDEIVALRQAMTHDSAAIAALCNHARDKALEEAVQACTDQTSDDPPPGTYNDACEDCAAAIRALKGKPA